VGLFDRLTTALAGGEPVHDFGTIATGGASGREWRLDARLRRRRRAWVLMVELATTEDGEEDWVSADLVFRSADELVEPFSDVWWRVEDQQQPAPDTGSKLTSRLIGLVGLGIVHAWEGVGGGTSSRAARIDLYLLRDGKDSTYRLFLFGAGASRGLWPVEVAPALADLGPELRRLTR
jgi:hypothetical protein